MKEGTTKYFEAQEKRMETDQIEGQLMAFDDPEKGKSTEMKINKVNRILGSGSHGSWVAEVNVELVHDTSPERKTHNMVLKKYWTDNPKTMNNLSNSYHNYKTIYNLGIPTWDTYRINDENKVALMTLGIKDDEILLTATDFRDERPSNELFKANPLQGIENTEEFIQKLKHILSTANDNLYNLRPDMYGIVFRPTPDKPGFYHLAVLITDLDGLEKNASDQFPWTEEEKIDYCNVENLRNIEVVLRNIFELTKTEGEELTDQIIQNLK